MNTDDDLVVAIPGMFFDFGKCCETVHRLLISNMTFFDAFCRLLRYKGLTVPITRKATWSMPQSLTNAIAVAITFLVNGVTPPHRLISTHWILFCRIVSCFVEKHYWRSHEFSSADRYLLVLHWRACVDGRSSALFRTSFESAQRGQQEE